MPLKHQRVLGGMDRAGGAGCGEDEVGGVIRSLEAQQVRLEQVAQERAAIRRRGQHVGRGEGGVQEETDGLAHPVAAQQGG